MIDPARPLAYGISPSAPRTLGLARMEPHGLPVRFRGLDLVDLRVFLAPLEGGPASLLAPPRLTVQRLLVSSGRVHDAVPGLRRRAREVAWRRANTEELRLRFLGQWIVLEGTEIIANGPDPAVVVETARQRGIRSPYVFRVETAKAPRTSSLGL